MIIVRAVIHYRKQRKSNRLLFALTNLKQHNIIKLQKLHIMYHLQFDFRLLIIW